MNDNELFELCKATYEATGWSIGNNSYSNWWMTSRDGEFNTVRMYKEENEHWSIVCPLYTSDYLLEKLSSEIVFYFYKDEKKDKYIAALTDGPNGVVQTSAGPTLLKALLKLTLELHKKGLLDDKDN